MTTETTKIAPVLNWCPKCGLKLTEKILTNKEGNTITSRMCSNCGYMYNPVFGTK